MGTREHVVVVAFDVEAATHEDAARLVAYALRDAPAAVQQPGTDFVEAWWYPEPRHKHIDGNDRWPYELMPPGD